MGKVRQGLTLAETVLALGLLTTIALAVIGVFSKLLTAGVKNADQSVGRALAEKVLDRALQEGPPGWGVGSGSTQINLYSHDNYSGTSFTYSVTPVRLTTPKPTYPMGNVYHVQVEVYWWNGAHDGTGSRREVGKLWTRIEQLRYYED